MFSHNQIIITVLLLCHIWLVIASEQDDSTSKTIVHKTENGNMLGNTDMSRGGTKFYSFLGVRYAHGTRFGNAIPIKNEKREEIMNATQFGDNCPQFGGGGAAGSEDCFFLNIYTPNLKKSAKLNVLVWIHGGAYQFGSGSEYDPNYFMDHKIVVVTLNYRLGIIGFLSSGDGNILGNWGLKDQQVALKWVKNNIHNFGGDPTQVTIFGESSGAASVNYHVISPSSNGLFKSAIALSGSALNPWTLQRNPDQDFEKVVNQVGCTNSGSSNNIVNCLREVDLDKLMKVQNDVMKWFMYPISTFAPVVEPSTAEDTFITQHPYNAMKNGRINKIAAYMTGFNANEGLFFTAPLIFSQLNKDLNTEFERVAPIALMYNDLSEEDKNAFSKKVKILYCGEYEKEFKKENWPELEALFGDRFIRHGVVQTAQLLSKHVPVYSYLFNFVGKHSVLKPLWGVDDIYGVSHADELQYLFKGWGGLPSLPITDEATEEESKSAMLSVNLVMGLTKFAVTGKAWGMGKETEWKEVKPRVNNAWYKIDIITGTEDIGKLILPRLKIWDKLDGGGDDKIDRVEL